MEKEGGREGRREGLTHLVFEEASLQGEETMDDCVCGNKNGQFLYSNLVIPSLPLSLPPSLLTMLQPFHTPFFFTFYAERKPQESKRR